MTHPATPAFTGCTPAGAALRAAVALLPLLVLVAAPSNLAGQATARPDAVHPAHHGSPPHAGHAGLEPARVDSIFSEMNRPDGPGAVVAVLRNGSIVLERGYGLAQLEYDVPVVPSTVFHVASVSKQFATFAVTLLAQQGQLSLDDDIRRHLPELHDFGRPITVRHLVHHTSGIRDQWELLMMAGWRLDDVITRDQIMALMRRQRELNFEPGAEHLYSNMGYTLLAEIVERASGQPFGEYLQAHVFEPLGMQHTHVHNDHERVVPRRAYSYRPGPGGNGWRNAVLSYANQGATSLFTTAGDLARWLHNYETAQVGGAAAITQMRERGVLTTGDTIPYAFAIVRGEHRGRTTWSHGGADAGFRSVVMHFPDEQLGIVVLANSATANPQRLALAVADVYLGESEPLPQFTPMTVSPQSRAAWEPSAAQLSDLAGDYYSPELGTVYTLEMRSGVLFIVHPRLADVRLLPTEEDAFRAGSRTLRIERAEDGAVSGFRLTGSRVRNVAFRRLLPGALPALD
jgi:CubicO group peptidase (beta-lactamase class C family)